MGLICNSDSKHKRYIMILHSIQHIKWKRKLSYFFITRKLTDSETDLKPCSDNLLKISVTNLTTIAICIYLVSLNFENFISRNYGEPSEDYKLNAPKYINNWW